MPSLPDVPDPIGRRPSLLARVMALVAPRALSEPLAQADYALELLRNTQLRDATVAEKERVLSALRSSTIDRLRRLRRAVVLSAVSMASAVLVAYLFHVTNVAPMLPRPVLAIGSIFCFATATLSRLGWKGQTIKGDTSVEELNQRVFHVLYWIGMCWGTLAIL